MDNTQFSNDKIDAAIAAYHDMSPEAIHAFMALGELDAAVVIRVLKASATPEKSRVGRPRGSKSKPRVAPISESKAS